MTPDVAAIGEMIITFLGPVRSSIIEGGTFRRAWEPSGPWHPVEE